MGTGTPKIVDVGVAEAVAEVVEVAAPDADKVAHCEYEACVADLTGITNSPIPLSCCPNPELGSFGSLGGVTD